MGIGLIAIQTTQKRRQSGPPFDTSSAENGLSVDSVTGRIVLGNDVGDPAQPAALLSDREIITEDSLGNLFTIFLNAIQNLVQTELNGLSVVVRGQDNSSPSIEVIGGDSSAASLGITTGPNATADLNLIGGAGSNLTYTMASSPDRLVINVDGGGIIDIGVSNIITPINVIRFQTATRAVQIGTSQVNFNGAAVQLTGSTTRRLFVSGKGAGTYNVDRDLDSDVLFFNSAAANANFALPSMIGALNRSGFIFRVVCKDAAGVTTTAAAGQVIMFGSLRTSSGGTLRSTDVGAYLMLNWDGSNWVTETFNGAWVLT